MLSSLSSLVDNLSGGLRKCTYCKSCLDYRLYVKDNQLLFRCFECKKNDKKDFNNKIIKRFENIYKFCNADINNFILLLREEFIHMNTWFVGKDLMKYHCLIKKLFIVA